MATLVLSTVGTIFGGPLGGAIGALVGQSIDQQVFGSGARGPKLGDLHIQTSTYGTQIPRVYGAMRVAGSVIWSTDLVQSEQTSGAKGQPDVTFSYAVSFAVALSSRQVGSIGRIWADGKLLRGADGAFKISTGFRFYDGSEDQVVDPLIGSIEGASSTPAYRGLALAIFENMQLAEYGNRIPFLTFEVLADPEPPTLGAILTNSSGSAIELTDTRTVLGYAAYGQSVSAAVEPLVSSFDIALFDDGSVLRGPLDLVPLDLAIVDLGHSADGKPQPRFDREQQPVQDLPAVLRLSYYDPERDYQSGEARAVAGERSGREVQEELPAVLEASSAKALVQEMIAANWARRDRLTLRLPPGELAIEPGSRVAIDLTPSLWIVEQSMIEGFVAVVELRPARGSSPNIAADGGRFLAPVDIAASALSIAVFDVPTVSSDLASEPTLLIAASSPSEGWRSSSVELEYAGQRQTLTTAGRKSLLGKALGALGDGDPNLIDERNAVDVDLVDPDQWLTNCDDTALIAGANLAVLGDELIQFASAVPLGAGRFRLSRLVRGRGGSEWASAGHETNETFLMLEPGTFATVKLPAFALGTTLAAAPVMSGETVSLGVRGDALRPPAPVALAGQVESNGDLSLRWTRRSRAGWAWIDDVDAPLGESREDYRIELLGSASNMQISTSMPQANIPAASLAALGSGLISVSVRQVGDHAISRPTTIAFNL